jgi:hypothetical protein
MAQAVSRWHLIAEARIRARSVPVGFVLDKLAVGQVFHRLLRFLLSVLFHRGSLHLYHHHLGNARWWLQFRDINSPHRH